MGIGKDQSGASLLRGALFVADGPLLPVRRSPRVGVDHAGAWAKKLWRFSAAGSPCVSRGPAAGY